MLTTTRNLCLTILAAGLALAAADLSLGTWKLNVAKSRFGSQPKPKSSTIVISREGDWTVQKTNSIDADGKPTTFSNRYKLDGKEYPWKGRGGEGNISIKVIDDYHSEWVVRGEGGLEVKGRTVISKDGKTRTQTSTGVDSQGQKSDTMRVYDRQ